MRGTFRRPKARSRQSALRHVRESHSFQLDISLMCFCDSHLLSIHELGLLLDEEMTMKEKEELKEAEAVCRRFLVCELDPETEVDGGRKEELSKVLERPEY